MTSESVRVEQRMTMAAFHRHLRRLGACRDAVTWANTQPDPETLWAACERGDWMLWLAASADVRRQDVVLAACACARLALPHVRAGEDRPLRAIETAERWARGDAGVTLAEVRDAAADAAAAYAADAAADAADAAAAYAADAAADAADAAYAADAADAAAAYAADAAADAADAAAADAADAAAAYAADAARTRLLRECADLVRARIPWPTVAAALEARS